MSQASDMIAEVKGLVAEIEKEVKGFEKQVEEVAGVPGGPDTIQLGKMLIHGRVFQADLRNRRGNVEDAQLAELEAQEAADPNEGAFSAEAGIAPLTEAALTGAPAEAPPESAQEAAQEPATAPVDDPAAGLIAGPQTPENPTA